MTDDVTIRHWRPLEPRHAPHAFALLKAAYSEPQRGYHNWDHVVDLFDKRERYAHLATRPDLIDTAIFWHDSVYTTCDANGLLRSDLENVRASAALFERHARFDKTDTDVIHEMIMATANHLDASASREFYPGFARDLDLFLDLDLGSLAASWPVFEKNLERIQFEYSWVPEHVFCMGRLQMLTTFAARGAGIYRLKETREAWGEIAQANIARAMIDLRAQLASLASSA